jgi:hypothetical protein
MMIELRPILNTLDIVKMTGWSRDHVRKLIIGGKLPAADVSLGGVKPRYAIRREDWLAFITPKALQQSTPSIEPKKTSVRSSKKRIDAGLPKVF